MNSHLSELKMTYSCLLRRGKQKIVRVTFEQNGAFAEGIVPDGKIEKQTGFSEEEVSQLEMYLKLNKNTILKNAEKISGIGQWFS